MFTILQDTTNKLQIFKTVEFTHLLIVFTYQHREVVGIFENKSVDCPYYLIDVIEVGEDGTVNNELGQIKLSPQTTWTGVIYGQNSSNNLFPVNATLLDTYKFQVKGDNTNTYPVISPNIDCAPATAVLLNTVPSELSSTNIDSGDSANITAPDATAVVKDQAGNILATENIPSGVSEDIVVNAGLLYTYNYPALNTGQEVSYATGDDKWVRDNVFNPEVATWDTNLKWVFPVLDTNDFTKLITGSNPDGSGNNIFGNKERFTDENGLQVYANDYYIDHLTGLSIFIQPTVVNRTYLQLITYAQSINILGFNDFHAGNKAEITSIQNNPQTGLAFEYPPFNIVNIHDTVTTTRVYRNGNPTEMLRMLSGASLLTVLAVNSSTSCLNLGFRKAFTYNPTTKEMELL